MILTDAQRLAEAFSRQLWDCLTLHELELAILRNDKQTDNLICHSHDVCDANMTMDDAFQDCFGHRQNFGDDDGESRLVNDAWDIAKASSFHTPGSALLRRLCLEELNWLYQSDKLDGTESTDQIYSLLMEHGWHHETMKEVYPGTDNLKGDEYGNAIDGFDGEAVEVIEWLGRWNHGLII